MATRLVWANVGSQRWVRAVAAAASWNATTWVVGTGVGDRRHLADLGDRLLEAADHGGVLDERRDGDHGPFEDRAVVAVDDDVAADAVAVDHDVVTAALDEHVAAHRPTADDERAVAVIDDGAGQAQATGDGVGADVAFESADDDVRFRRRGAHHDGSGAGDVDRMEAERPRADHAAEDESGRVGVCRRSGSAGRGSGRREDASNWADPIGS